MAAEWLWLTVWSAAHAADCEESTAPAQLQAHADRAHTAFGALDIDQFLEASDTLRAELPCLDSLVPPQLAAAIHRVEGLRAFGERSVDTVRAFAAARTADPLFAFDASVVPPGSPVLEDYLAMDLDAADLEEQPPPAEAALFVDGRATPLRPTAWPAIVQLQSSDGTLLWTTYARHTDTLPTYEVVPPPPPPAEVALAAGPLRDGPPSPPPPPRRRPVPLLVGAGATALAGIAMYGAAARTRAVYDDPLTSDDRLPGLHARTNGLVVASSLAGLTAVGLGTAVVITW
ncbi:MAG: hypothetical protein KTR31_23400 [Myxococcales bacterium]|nr:hypothetical protein [Myxococcales bacterium]